MSNPLCTYTGLGSTLTGFLCNVTSGNLSEDQVANIKADAAQSVANASAGRQPSVIQTIIDQTNKDIDIVLHSFAMPGETGADVGAAPDQSGFRLGAFGGNVTLPKIADLVKNANFVFWAGLALVGTALLFPVIAPHIKRNIAAVRSLR
jgi:hypothetical protein